MPGPEKWMDFDSSYERVTESGCWIWLGMTNSRGYGLIWNGVKKISTHRYSYEKHYGPIPDGLFVCHHCDVRMCVNPSHLYAGTRLQNVADMVRRKRSAFGERMPFSKLKDEQVGHIKSVPKYYGVNTELAKQYGLHPSTIHAIRKGKKWRHI